MREYGEPYSPLSGGRESKKAETKQRELGKGWAIAKVFDVFSNDAPNNGK